MPCRKENYILLEQSVTVDSKEVDALVSKIGEALQLHNNSSSHKGMSRLHGLASGTCVKPSNTNGSHGSSSSAGGQRRNGCCMRLRSRSLRTSRASPYNPPGSSDQEWGHFKSSWNRKKIDVKTGDEDDPHQLLQELILSGNLIKEAVRRLKFSSEPPEHDISKPVD
ncbi:GSK-3-binding protein-like [Myxocyprinus asiaticus]|uniref:GSK-3-binding protein-like n=1 Tax=Myxocyprinus asiaticus TaxID=70543 RepID=UPI0022212D85|nr:GSK-3-binding protein-like [Myxocyprinus asiaticus]